MDCGALYNHVGTFYPTIHSQYPLNALLRCTYYGNPYIFTYALSLWYVYSVCHMTVTLIFTVISDSSVYCVLWQYTMFILKNFEECL